MQVYSLSDKIYKIITLLLGIFWVIDGILQFQPKMFTQLFPLKVLYPLISAQPIFLRLLIHTGINIFSSHLIIFNVLAASLQLLVGLILIIPDLKDFRITALYISIIWALIVWVFGQGLGMIFTGSASFYTGAPGSAILYIIIAIFLLFPKSIPEYYMPQVAGLILFIGGILNETHMFWTKAGQSMLLNLYLGNNFVLLNVIEIGILFTFGILLIIKPTKILGWVMVFFLLLIWCTSQGFGGVINFPNGLATDLSSAPLFMLFIVPLLYNNKSYLLPTIFDEKKSVGIINRVVLNKWFFAIILICIGVFMGFIFNISVNSTSKNTVGVSNMSM